MNYQQVRDQIIDRMTDIGIKEFSMTDKEKLEFEKLHAALALIDEAAELVEVKNA